jgi:hypothetical protein
MHNLACSVLARKLVLVRMSSSHVQNHVQNEDAFRSNSLRVALAIMDT